MTAFAAAHGVEPAVIPGDEPRDLAARRARSALHVCGVQDLSECQSSVSTPIFEPHNEAIRRYELKTRFTAALASNGRPRGVSGGRHATRLAYAGDAMFS